MGIFDKILGKETEEQNSAVGKKPEAGKAPKPKKGSAEKKPAVKATTKLQNVAPKKSKLEKKEDNGAWKVLVSTWVTEKSTVLGQFNKYVFKVRPEAGKYQIKEAVEGYYGVRVSKVNTVKIKPKKRIQGRTIGYKKAYKKAIVTLQPGDSIAVTEGV